MNAANDDCGEFSCKICLDIFRRKSFMHLGSNKKTGVDIRFMESKLGLQKTKRLISDGPDCGVFCCGIMQFDHFGSISTKRLRWKSAFCVGIKRIKYKKYLSIRALLTNCYSIWKYGKICCFASRHCTTALWIILANNGMSLQGVHAVRDIRHNSFEVVNCIQVPVKQLIRSF